MVLLVGLALLAVFAIPLAVAIYRSNELFRFRVRAGKIHDLRGRLPQALLSDLEDVFAHTSKEARVRVVSEQRRPRVILHGVDGDVAQRVRNVVGRFRVPEIRSGGRAVNRSKRR